MLRRRQAELRAVVGGEGCYLTADYTAAATTTAVAVD